MEHRNQDSLNKDNRMIAIKVTQLHERCPELTFLSSVKIGQGLGGGGDRQCKRSFYNGRMKHNDHLFIGGAGWSGEYHAGCTSQIPGYGCNLEAP